MKQLISVLLLMTSMLHGSAHAVYNANMSGRMDSLSTYAEDDTILIHIENQPTSHPGCNASYFAISNTVPADKRKMMFARLALAYATKESVNIGYDEQGDCANGYIRVHRVG